MDKGEGIMAIPQGDITTSEILVPEVVQDPVQDLDEEELPELEQDDLL
jgi:hypothetical protein